jgi:hypothetical protein
MVNASKKGPPKAYSAPHTARLPKVVIEVRYKDKTGRWKGTNSLSLNDIPKAILALQKAFEYLTGHKEPGTQENAGTDLP